MLQVTSTISSGVQAERNHCACPDLCKQTPRRCGHTHRCLHHYWLLPWHECPNSACRLLLPKQVLTPSQSAVQALAHIPGLQTITRHRHAQHGVLPRSTPQIKLSILRHLCDSLSMAACNSAGSLCGWLLHVHPYPTADNHHSRSRCSVLLFCAHVAAGAS
jgi:hypothetical protein